MFTVVNIHLGCEIDTPHWIGDGWCDDETNNEACQFDGGDCCENDQYYWDDYCVDCHCFEEWKMDGGCFPSNTNNVKYYE